MSPSSTISRHTGTRLPRAAASRNCASDGECVGETDIASTLAYDCGGAAAPTTSTVHAEDDPPPVDGYERLGARDAMRVLKDLPRTTLERLYSYEDLHLRRSSVLRAIGAPSTARRRRRQKVGT